LRSASGNESTSWRGLNTPAAIRPAFSAWWCCASSGLRCGLSVVTVMLYSLPPATSPAELH